MEDCFLKRALECPGRYCGRIASNVSVNGSCYNDCGACPTGYRVDQNTSECLSCDDPALLRDYLFLGFVCLVCVAVRLSIIAGTTVGKPQLGAKLVLVALTGFENALSMLCTLLVLEPQGSLGFNSCRVLQVSDFYPIFYNPTLDYVHQIKCTYEVVYPLYRMIFIFFGFYLLFHVALLPVTIPYMWYFRKSFSQATEFAWLVALPVVIMVFAVFAGLLYYTFDYLTIFVAVGGFAIISTVQQALKYTFKNPFQVMTTVEQWVFTGVCMLYLAYGILSLTDAGTVVFRSQLLPIILALPLFHPLLTYLASPQPYLTAWGVNSYHTFYDH